MAKATKTSAVSVKSRAATPKPAPPSKPKSKPRRPALSKIALDVVKGSVLAPGARKISCLAHVDGSHHRVPVVVHVVDELPASEARAPDVAGDRLYQKILAKGWVFLRLVDQDEVVRSVVGWVLATKTAELLDMLCKGEAELAVTAADDIANKQSPKSYKNR